MVEPGEIILYWGPMFAGKTSHLIKHLQEAGEGAICFKPYTDNRNGLDVIGSHDGFEIPATPLKSAYEIFKCLDNAITTIGIDEASLFYNDPFLIPTIKKLRDMGYTVILTGLDRDYRDLPFGQIPEIAAIADQAIKLRAKCICGKSATICYLKEKHKQPITARELVGGAEKWEVICRTCYNRRLLEGDLHA